MRGRGVRIGLLACACAAAIPAAAQVAPVPPAPAVQPDGHVDTLQEALAAAYHGNPTILSARANQRATDENVPIDRAAELPNLSGTATYTEFALQSAGSFSSPDRSIAGQLSLSVPIYAGGANRNNLEAAKVRVVAGREDLRGTESSVFNQVVAAYMDVIQNEALVGLTANNVRVLEVNLQSTQDQFQIGQLTRTDVAQSQSRLALARGDLRTAQSNLIRAKESFTALVGRPPVDLQPPPPLPGLPADVDTAVQIAIGENPDLAGAQQRALASKYDVKVAGASRLPTVSAFASGGTTDYLGSISSGIPGFSQPQIQTSGQIGVRATIPLYQGGRPAAQQRQAQDRLSAAQETAVGQERNVISQVRAAYAAWQASNAIIASTQTAVSAASLSLEGVRAENTVGNRTILDILNAQQELLQAQVQLVTARRNAYVAGFTLLAAMGRAEARDLGLEAYGPLYDPAVNYNRVKSIIWDWQRDPDPVAQAPRTVDIPAQSADIPADVSTATSTPVPDARTDIRTGERG